MSVETNPALGFDWLRAERAEIKAQRFHLFGNECWAERKSDESDGSHASFLRAFGESRLYRNGFGCHLFVGKPELTPLCGLVKWPKPVLEIAAYTDGRLFMEVGDAEVGRPGPLLTHVGSTSGLRFAGDRFDVWLSARAKLIRKRYTKRHWRAYAADPPPFTVEEESILRARELFAWEVTRSLSDAGNPRDEFLITNRSERRLDLLTIGVRSTSVVGAVWLDVSTIAPGESGRIGHIVPQGSYRNAGPGDNYSIPRPLPEERDLLRELHFDG